ncbi:MAG: putative sugar nucleotidyl transferase [Sphingobacteriales bacterium]|nr:putative sugar nucleotidyl transferase [Sphingobacteriales bacterium]
MTIILDDSLIRDQLYPFAQIRHAADIRVGILTIREKWEKILGYAVSLDAKAYFNSVEESGRTEMPAIIAANTIPTKEWVTELLKGGNMDRLFSNNEGHRTISRPWEIFQHNDWALRKDFELICSGRTSQPISSTNTLINPEQIFMEVGAVVEHAILNATDGPIYIGKNATIMEGSMIRGPFALCEGAVVKMGAKIYGATTIGPFCVAAGEIKNSILFGYSNKAHDGYLGDSVLGEWCNLGAGTSNSNVKNTAGAVKAWNNATQDWEEVGLKCGLMMGDYSRSAINTSFNTGTVIGVSSHIFGQGFPPKFVPDFTWGDVPYAFEKALTDIQNWKQLKGATINEAEQQRLHEIYHKN